MVWAFSEWLYTVTWIQRDKAWGRSQLDVSIIILTTQRGLKSNLWVSPGSLQDINLKQVVRFEAQVINSILKQPFPDLVLWDFKHPAVLGRSNADGKIVIEGMLPVPFEFNVGEGESKNYGPILSNSMPMAISAVDSTSSLIRNAIIRGKTRLPLSAVSAHARCSLSESGAIRLANSFLPTDGKSLVFLVDVFSVGCELLDRGLLRKLGNYRRIFRCGFVRTVTKSHTKTKLTETIYCKFL